MIKTSYYVKVNRTDQAIQFVKLNLGDLRTNLIIVLLFLCFAIMFVLIDLPILAGGSNTVCILYAYGINKVKIDKKEFRQVKEILKSLN